MSPAKQADFVQVFKAVKQKDVDEKLEGFIDFVLFKIEIQVRQLQI